MGNFVIHYQISSNGPPETAVPTNQLLKETKMSNRTHNALALATAGIIAAVALPLGVALAAMQEGDHAGKNANEIADFLSKQGYVVEEIEVEDGKLEANVVLDGKEYEIYIDPETGNIVKIEEDD
jgi:hypothetical protein